jgi:hypothetical protein
MNFFQLMQAARTGSPMRYQEPNDGNGNDLGGGEGGGEKPNKGAEGGEGGQGGQGDPAKPKMSDAEALLLKDLMKHKETAKNAQTEVQNLKDQLKKFDGIDSDAVRALLADKAKAEEQALEAKGEWDRLKERMGEAHKTELATVQDQLKALQGQLAQSNSMIDELTVGSQFGQSKFIAEELTLTPAKTRVVFGQHFELVDGVVTAFDKPKGSANRTPLVDSSGNALDFDSALRKIVEADTDKDHLLKSKARSGSGSDNKPATPAAKAVKDAASKVTEASGVSKISSGLAGLKIG